MDAVAVIVAGASRVDALVPIAGVPLLVRAVEGLLGAGGFTRVHVLLDVSIDHARVRDACAGLPVVVHPHALQRRDGVGSNGSSTLRRISDAADAVVVHDVARGLAPSVLVAAVLAGLRDGHDAVVPVLPLTDTVKQVDGSGLLLATPDRAGLRVVQTPQAFRSAAIDTVLVTRQDTDPLRLALAMAASGIGVHTVAGDPMAFAVLTTTDVDMAGTVAALGECG